MCPPCCSTFHMTELPYRLCNHLSFSLWCLDWSADRCINCDFADQTEGLQTESILNIKFGISGNRTIGAHTPALVKPGGNGELLFKSVLVLQRPVLDPCIAVGFLPFSSNCLRVGQLVNMRWRVERLKDLKDNSSSSCKVSLWSIIFWFQIFHNFVSEFVLIDATPELAHRLCDTHRVNEGCTFKYDSVDSFWVRYKCGKSQFRNSYNVAWQIVRGY